MPNFSLRTVLDFCLDEDSKWFADKKRLGAVVDALLATDLAAAITHAGAYGKERPAMDAAAVRKGLVTGKPGTFVALDGASEQLANAGVWFKVGTDRLKVTITVDGPTLATQTTTILDSMVTVGRALVSEMRDLGGLALGFTHPEGAEFEYPQPRPPVTHRRLEVASILDFIDLKFHRSGHDDAQPDQAVPMGTEPVPKGVERIVEDDLVVLRWIGSVADDREVAMAAGRHARWLSGIVELDRSSLFNDQGDQVVELSERVKRAPFTMYDEDENIGYKAIVVDPKGNPDDEIWGEMVKALAARKQGLAGIRLIAPLRKLALALEPQARKAGFDAVLYPGDDNQLWDPAPRMWWIDEPAEGPAAKKRK